MIRDFKDKETEKVYNQHFSRIPPANHLEQLNGNREGQYSIRINDQFRICFRFCDGDFFDVEITDYH